MQNAYTGYSGPTEWDYLISNRAGMGQDIGAMGQLGALRSGQDQARLTADQQMHQYSSVVNQIRKT